MQQRLFEDLIESDVVAHKTKQGYTLPVSIAIHAIVLLAVVVVPLLTSEELPEPTSVVKAFFVEPAAPPPPPPPPPPTAPRHRRKRWAADRSRVQKACGPRSAAAAWAVVRRRSAVSRPGLFASAPRRRAAR